MARPVNADAAATKQRILDSALVLFAEQGPGQSSIRQIAKHAGVSLGMVHHYFGSKEDLFGACVDSMYEELAALREDLGRTLAEGGTVPELLERAVRTTFRFTRRHVDAMRLMLREVVATGELDDARREGFLVPFLEQASALIGGFAGRSPESLRLPLQSIVFLSGRYAIGTERELMLVTGAPTPEAALAAVEDHLVAVARDLLGIH